MFESASDLDRGIIVWCSKMVSVKEGTRVGKYTIVKRLGGGAFGTVFKVTDDSGKEFALKIYERSEGGLNDAEKEAKMYSFFSTAVPQNLDLAVHGDKLRNPRLQGLFRAAYGRTDGLNSRGCHPNIVCMLDQFTDKEYGRVVVTELMDGDLEPAEEKLPRNQKEFCKMILDVMAGIAAMHAQNFVHADIKPANLLYKDGEYKVGDLGNSCGDSKCAPSGTADFMAPEMASWFVNFRKRMNSTELLSSDIWSLGVTFISIMTGGELPYTSKITGDGFRDDMSSDEWIRTLAAGVTVKTDPKSYRPRSGDRSERFYRPRPELTDRLVRVILEKMVVPDHRGRDTAISLLRQFRGLIGQVYPELTGRTLPVKRRMTAPELI